MEEEAVTSDEDVGAKTSTPRPTKKRKSFGRVSDAAKRLRAQSHELGPDCTCRNNCSGNISEQEKNDLIGKFNALGEWSKQTDYLSGLISIKLVKNRKPKRPEGEANFRTSMFSYRVRIVQNNIAQEKDVCQVAFRNLHGISKKRLEHLQKALQGTGMPAKDLRGKHLNRPHKLVDDSLNCVENHIASFKGRMCHYSLEKTQKTYLSEELNVKKMHMLYKDVYPLNPVSYESYRKVFVTKFNISFGFPRSDDTCAICDQFTAKVKSLKLDLLNSSGQIEQKSKIENEIRKLETENKVHKTKANTFYVRKRQAKRRCRKKENFESLSMDYQKNLPTPNITTNVVYYKRQLSMYSFNIHRLSDNDVVIYAYPETVGCKGSNEVVSFSNHYVHNHLDPKVKELEIFCDSCGGQNKNYTLIRYCHYLVCGLKKLENIKLTFPVVGHSYMECDKDVGLINSKALTETPDDWIKVFEEARIKPAPFKVIKVETNMIRDWKQFLEPLYLEKCVFATRPVRELKIQQEHTRLIYHRDSFNGFWYSSVVTPRKDKEPKKKNKNKKPEKEDEDKQLTMGPLMEGEFYFPPPAYAGCLCFVELTKMLLNRSQKKSTKTSKLFPSFAVLRLKNNMNNCPYCKFQSKVLNGYWLNSVKNQEIQETKAAFDTF